MVKFFKNFLFILLLMNGVPSEIFGQVSLLFELPTTNGVTFSEINDDQNSIRIHADENILAPFNIAILNYEGDKITINFILGTPNILELINYGSKWALSVITELDYERENNWLFQLIIDTQTYLVNFRVVNLFDNNPSIRQMNDCLIPELEGNYQSDCIFNVYDPDGIANNNFIFEIVGDNNEEELFELKELNLISTHEKSYQLYTKQELNYKDRVMYIFKINVFDQVQNSGSTTAIVEVDDVPNLDPVWTQPFATARFLEKQPQTFQVTAVDGDTKINTKIHYKILFDNEFELNYNDIISIEMETGKINILPIDRDARQQEVYQFNIIAYKWYDETISIQAPAVLIVDDINDNNPLITLNPNVIRIREETYLTLPFTALNANDIDLGTHATYSISLAQPVGSEINYASAFTVIPSNGYQETSFSINVADSSLLDYENSDWRIFDLKIVAKEISDQTHFDEQTFKIELINWNDEVPTFIQDEFEISIEENIMKGQIIITCLATDRDIDDSVNHTIVGGMSSVLNIDQNGVITTIVDNGFDYERQTTVLIQIRATDTLKINETDRLNTAFAQLTINVLDVNDETPEIRMPRGDVDLPENSPHGTIVTNEILGMDPDTTAALVFEIDWENSYATKSGQWADKNLYINCFTIETEKTATPNTVYGHLKVNTGNPPKDIDYEEYDVIYLTIRITDTDQLYDNFAEGVLTVRILDLNDNAPEFTADTLETSRSVVEEAIDNTLVGTILATDRDGPQFNIITYSMAEIGNTPIGFLEIDAKTGTIFVKPGSIIDCDEYNIEFLEYEVIVSDGEHTTPGNIQIRIIDINDQSPEFREFNKNIDLYENSTTGQLITIIEAFDRDRDAPHNVLQYMINFLQNPELSEFFEVDRSDGTLIVNLIGAKVLDRETKERHDIPIKVQDNYLGTGRTNSEETIISLRLLDINDNAPEMPTPSSFNESINENAIIGTQIGQNFIAPDKDDPTTPNSKVRYRIDSIVYGEDSQILAGNIFEILSVDDSYGRLLVKESLKGYFGVWKITIEAYDLGHLFTTEKSLSSKETYDLTVNPYNYNPPIIQFPIEDKPIRLRFTNQTIGSSLYTVTNEALPLFTAEDNDGFQYGDVTFTITSFIPESGDVNIFEIVKLTRHTSELRLKSPCEAKFYRINVLAEDGGQLSREITNVLISFVDMEGEPIFPYSEIPDIVTFTEEDDGLLEAFFIREAEDPKNSGITNENELYDIYYFIDYTYNPTDAKFFKLDSVTRRITLDMTLDRETKDKHEILIIATNNISGPNKVEPSSTMVLTIYVNDINDNPPYFITNSYSSGITDKDAKDKPILVVEAIDPDIDVVKYYIVKSSIVAEGENIEHLKESMFQVAETTGVVTLSTVPKDTMSGFFTFNIEAQDLVGHTALCTVKIYIIAEFNRITFVFQNSTEELDTVENIAIMANIFSNQFELVCNIDDVQQYDLDPEFASQLTNVRAHFLDNNEAVEAEKIHEKIASPVFLAKLKSELLEKSLFLADVPNNIVVIAENMEGLLRTLLIVVSVVLGAFCIILLAAFIIRTRSLNRQLKALSPTDFGSTSSNLNRREVPTSNVYAIEGKNPVLNHNDNTKFDTLSIQSDESDFDKDFDKDPTFMMNHESDSKNSALIEEIRKKSINPITSNGIDKPTLLSPEFYPPRHM